MTIQAHPFVSNVRTGSKYNKLVKPGFHEATLAEVKTKEMDDKKNPGQRITKVLVVFYIPSEDAEVTMWFTPSLFERSKLAMFLSATWPVDFQALKDKPQELWNFLLAQVGKDFNVAVQMSGQYVNITSAFPKNQPSAPVSPQAPAFAGGVVVSDDDIPF